MLESNKMGMVYGNAPGSGFLPFWLSLVLAGLSLLLILNGLRRPTGQDSRIAWPSGRGLGWIAATTVALLAYPFLVPIIGYILSTFAFIFVLVYLLGSYRWYTSASLSLGLAVGLYLIFQAWLAMELPTGLLIIP